MLFVVVGVLMVLYVVSCCLFGMVVWLFGCWLCMFGDECMYVVMEWYVCC